MHTSVPWHGQRNRHSDAYGSVAQLSDGRSDSTEYVATQSVAATPVEPYGRYLAFSRLVSAKSAMRVGSEVQVAFRGHIIKQVAVPPRSNLIRETARQKQL
jgi:hypothetical protein